MNTSQLEESLRTLDADETVKSILSTLLNMSMWNERTEKVIITAINKLLSVSKSRLQGLEYLNLVIDNCSTKVIFENGITWISYCLIKYPEDNLKELKLTTIGRIIDHSYEEQEFSKAFISEYISKVFEICLTTYNSYHETGVALETLAICLKHYGSWFAPHKLRIQNFITSFLESSADEIVENASTAFHYVQQVGGAGIDGINHKTNFSTSFEKLCATVQTLFDIFFENENEMDQSDRSNQDVFEFTNLSYPTQKMLHITARRIKNCLKFIMTMLLKGFPAVKEIKPIDVLNLVSRGTAIHRCLSAETDNSLKDCQFSILLNQVHIELLRLLHVLIVWLHVNALPFTFIITKILVDCLNKSQNCQCFKTDSLYQEMVYKVLACWIRIAKGAVHTHFQAQLIKCILKDITPVTSRVTLSLQTDVLHNKSKKAKQKAVQERIISGGEGNTPAVKLTTTEKINMENNCLFALDTLKHILIGTILKLQPNTIQELYNTVINTLVNIQISKVSHPYTNLECQAKLYDVLVSFYEQDTLKTLPPLPLTIDILNRGANNNDRSIALICEHGLSILEKICQPVCPSLFISEYTPMNEVSKESVSFIDNKFVENILELKENGNKIGQSSNAGDELNFEILNISENEIDTHEKSTVHEENVELAIDEQVTQNDNESTTTLNTPIHIIDMQIIKTSTVNVESEEVVNTENSTINDKIQEDEGKYLLNMARHLKTEILSNNSVETCEHDTEIEPIGNEEPPLKKIRTEEATSDSQNVVKKELSQNYQDDVFEEESSEESSRLIKQEILSENSVEIHEHEEMEANKCIQHQNSLLKNIRSEEAANDLLDVVKEELSHKLENDMFEESDDFVDVVKDY